MADPDCLFCGIVAGTIPSETIDSDEKTVAFMDINPATPGHALVVPREHSADLLEIGSEDLTATVLAAQRLAKRMKDVLERRWDQPDQRLRRSGVADRLPLPHPRRAPLRG